MGDTNQETNEKKFSPQRLIVPAIIVVILIAFAGVVYYGNVISPKNEIDEEIGYNPEDYIQLDSYTGFEYEITQEDFDECVAEETDYYEEVERAAKDEDQIEFNYTGYIDGEKDKNISEKYIEITLGDDDSGIYKTFADAMIGHKSGETVEVEVDGEDANDLSEDGTDYTGQTITFNLKIRTVSKPVSDEVTDEWVQDYYYDDYGLETADDFYQWCKEYLEEDAKTELWQDVLDSTTMSSYPEDVYDDVVLEFTQDANYYADYFGMDTDEYLEFCGYDDDSLEEEYLNEVKSELVMWYIVKDQLLEASDADIEEEYEELYEDMGYDTVDDMKEDYTTDEIEEAVLLDKAQQYVYDNSTITESFVIPDTEEKSEDSEE